MAFTTINAHKTRGLQLIFENFLGFDGLPGPDVVHGK